MQTGGGKKEQVTMIMEKQMEVELVLILLKLLGETEAGTMISYL